MKVMVILPEFTKISSQFAGFQTRVQCCQLAVHQPELSCQTGLDQKMDIQWFPITTAPTNRYPQPCTHCLSAGESIYNTVKNSLNFLLNFGFQLFLNDNLIHIQLDQVLGYWILGSLPIWLGNSVPQNQECEISSNNQLSLLCFNLSTYLSHYATLCSLCRFS